MSREDIGLTAEELIDLMERRPQPVIYANDGLPHTNPILKGQTEYLIEELVAVVSYAKSPHREGQDLLTRDIRKLADLIDDTVRVAWCQGLRGAGFVTTQPCPACTFYDEPRGKMISRIPFRMRRILQLEVTPDAVLGEELIQRALVGLPDCDVCRGEKVIHKDQQVERMESELERLRKVEVDQDETMRKHRESVEKEISDLDDAIAEQYSDLEDLRATLREEIGWHATCLKLLDMLHDVERGVVDIHEVQRYRDLISRYGADAVARV